MRLLPVYARETVSLPPEQGKTAEEVDYAPLEAILTEEASYDAFFSCYSVPELPYRLNKRVFSELGGNVKGVPVVLLVFDVDDPVAHKENIPARPEWRAVEMFKISSLLAATSAFVYETKGGYRVVAGWLSEPFLVTSHEDAALWSALYKTHCRALKRRFGIEADERCADWQRLMRIPRACRDGVPQKLPTYGDPAAIGTWELEFEDADVVAPEEVSEAKPRPAMRDNPLARIDQAAAAVKKMKPAVQGAGAEDALWAACNEVLVGFDLPVDLAEQVIFTSYLPRCDVSLLGPEHFMQRARKKLEELNESAEKPYGWRLQAADVARLAAVARPVQHPQVDKFKQDASKNDSAAAKDIKDLADGAGQEPRQDSETRSIAQILEAFSPDVKPLPTPFQSLNVMTRGGLRPKAVVALAGAPGAGKTSLAVQLGAHYLERGVPVCMLAGDESIEFLLGRLAQRKGISRDDIEDGKPHAKAALAKAAEDWKFLPLDCDWEGCTVEHAATRLHELHGPGVLIVDSVQKTRTDTSGAAETAKGRVDDVIATVKQAASRFGHVVIVTSEINRSAYRNKDANQNVEDIAAAKESGDIEYGVKLLLVLKEGKDEDTVDVTVPKNRLGRGKPRWRLKWDHVRATFAEVEVKAVDEQAKAKDEQNVIMTEVWQHIRECNQKGRHLTSSTKVFADMSRLGKGHRKAKVLAAIATLELDQRLTKGSGHYEAI